MVFLTKEEEAMLSGREGHAAKKSMEIIVALAKIFGAEKLIGISSAQVSGVSYKNVGDEGLEFLRVLSKDGKARVSSYLNPAGMDLENWRDFGISESFAKKQLEVIEVFKKLGIVPTCTCAPYLVADIPKFGQHLAWGESSAVAVANSIFGARTNRESGISALASALTGKTAYYGYHLDENRKPTLTVEVEAHLAGEDDFGALGYHVGKIVKSGVPYFRLKKKTATVDRLRSLAAALASSGSVALFHVEGFTPEAKIRGFEAGKMEKISFGQEELDSAKRELSDGAEPDLVCVGCPHASLEEIGKIAKLLLGKKVKKEFWICCSRSMMKAAEVAGYAKTIEDAGAKFACDTCMVVCPIEELGYRTIATNSAKASNYSRNLNGLKVCYGPLERCVSAAVEGKW